MDIAYTEINGSKVYGDKSDCHYPHRLLVPLGRSVRYESSEISPDYHETELRGVPRYIGVMGDKYYFRRIFAGNDVTCPDFQELFAEYTNDLTEHMDTVCKGPACQHEIHGGV